MDRTVTGTTRRPEQPSARHFSRAMLTAALACFALPFLTVTCYGDDVTVSGVQAATGVDITPQAEPDPGDRQFAQEGEPPNAFAIVAIVAAAVSLALTFGSSRSRRSAVWAAATGVIALQGLFTYAWYRAHGEAFPDIGIAAATTLLVAAAWVGVGTVPRWVLMVGGVVVAATIPYSLLGTDAQASGLAFLAFLSGEMIAVTLAMGAIQASDRSAIASTERPSFLRLAIAGIVGLSCLGAAGVAGFFVLGGMISGAMEPTIGGAYTFTTVSTGLVVMSGVVALVGGRAISHPGRMNAAWAVPQASAQV